MLGAFVLKMIGELFPTTATWLEQSFSWFDDIGKKGGKKKKKVSLAYVLSMTVLTI